LGGISKLGNRYLRILSFKPPGCFPASTPSATTAILSVCARVGTKMLKSFC
jgi:hypothetical protein